MSATTSYIDEMLDPLTEAFTPEVAQRLVDLTPTPAEAERMAHLASKANEGELTSAEEAEYSARINVGDLISIMKLKARRFLEQNGNPNV